MKYLLLSFLLVSIPTLACTPAPIEARADVKNLLISELMTHEWASLEDLRHARVDDLKVLSYEWIKSDPGFECHDKEVVSGNVFVKYVGRDGKKECETEGLVTVTNSMYEGAPRPEFIIEILSSTCGRE